MATVLQTSDGSVAPLSLTQASRGLIKAARQGLIDGSELTESWFLSLKAEIQDATQQMKDKKQKYTVSDIKSFVSNELFGLQRLAPFPFCSNEPLEEGQQPGDIDYAWRFLEELEEMLAGVHDITPDWCEIKVLLLDFASESGHPGIDNTIEELIAKFM